MSSVGSIGVLVPEALLPAHECLWAALPSPLPYVAQSDRYRARVRKTLQALEEE